MVFQIPVTFKGNILDHVGVGKKLWNTDADIEALAAGACDPARVDGCGRCQPFSRRETEGLHRESLANKPEALFLYEPTLALDKAWAEKVESLGLRLEAEHSLTMLWVTH